MADTDRAQTPTPKPQTLNPQSSWMQMADTDRAFEHFDIDFDGQVDPVEFYEGLSHLPGMAEVSQWIEG